MAWLGFPGSGMWRATMETAVGIALIVIAALEIVFIVRTVQANTRA